MQAKRAASGASEAGRDGFAGPGPGGWCRLFCLIGVFACSEPKAPEPFTVEGLAACADAGCATHRAVGGISMGGGAAMRWALQYPELFDVAISLGSPYIDLEYFLISVSKVSNGGFCERDQLLTNLDRIDVKNDPATWCGPVHFSELALPNTACDGFSGDYNHYYRSPTSAGSGGSFDREASLEIVHDLAIAYGNPAFYNPDDPYLPPGVPLSHHVPIELDSSGHEAERAAMRSEICQNPVVFERFYDAAYNPTGEFPVITFCDGNGPINGEYEPGVATFPMEVALAVDFNRNGRRDYGEPVIAQPFELWSDFGSDGIPNAMEPGYDPIANPDPSGDDYHWLDRPLGTENNFRPDPGEAQTDDGLDGVPGTQDFGEGNGIADRNPNVDYAFERSPRRLLEEIDPALLDRLHLWADAGIRDFLLSAQITNQFWGSLLARGEEGTLISDWSDLAQLSHGGGDYDARRADLSEETIGRHAYLRYGDPAVCPGVDAETGRGNHVGSPREALDRILTAFAFASARLEGGDFRALPGSLADQGAPTGSLEDFVMVKSFASTALERDVPYVVMLPPDYYKSDLTRYPVVYFFHGQGQAVTDLAASALLILGPQMASDDADTSRAGRADWQKMIVVLADGQCRTADGECHTGTFFLDHRGVGGESFAHGEAFLELMREIDRTFRTKGPELLTK